MDVQDPALTPPSPRHPPRTSGIPQTPRSTSSSNPDHTGLSARLDSCSGHELPEDRRQCFPPVSQAQAQAQLSLC